MELNDYPPPNPYAQPASVPAQPVRPRRTGRIVAIVVASVLGLAVVVGLAVAAVLAAIDSRRADAEAVREFTSSDGTFTMTLPAGWGDETEAYRANFLKENGDESTIEGLATADGLPFSLSDNFVSMSGHPVGPLPDSAETIGSEDVDGWRDAFDEYTELAPATFTTDAGDVVWHGGLRGTTDGEEWMIVIATVVGDGSLARFDLQLDPPFYDARGAFLESLKSLVFAPTVAADDVAQNFEPWPDGRTYSSEGGASIIIPSAWVHLSVDADVAAFDPEIDFDFLGVWGLSDGKRDLPATAMLSVGPLLNAGSSARDEILAQVGDVGSGSADADGVMSTVLALGSWAAPGADDAAWVDLTVASPSPDPSLPASDPDVRRCYLLVHAEQEFSGCVLGSASAMDEAIAALEGALLTVEFAD